MNKRVQLLLASAPIQAAIVLSSGAVSAAGNAADGEDVFRKCMACHRVGEGAKIQVGPVLNGVIGRQAGTYPEFAYSDINKAAGANVLVWTGGLDLPIP